MAAPGRGHAPSPPSPPPTHTHAHTHPIPTTRYVCLYDVAERVMLRRFQVGRRGPARRGASGAGGAGRGSRRLQPGTRPWLRALGCPCLLPAPPHPHPHPHPSRPTSPPQISHNKSLDGVLDQLNSRNMTGGRPILSPLFVSAS